jgi:FtsH-binding integral membrane protein
MHHHAGTAYAIYKSNKTNKLQRRRQIMKKTLGTMIVAAVVVLLTATFSFAEFAASGASNFPYFQLGALIVGGMIIISLKYKYSQMYTSETVGAFALYTVLIALFTSPVIDAVKVLVS